MPGAMGKKGGMDCTQLVEFSGTLPYWTPLLRGGGVLGAR